jgi:RNA polymerase sigma-70 factor (ECF subfamily)
LVETLPRTRNRSGAAPIASCAATSTDIDTLMARLGRGEREVFTDVFKALWNPTLRLCLSLLKHEADAADAAQQAMQKVFERASDYDHKRPALPWALAIAAWECRGLRTKRHRRREAPTTAAELLQGGDDPEQTLVRRDLTDAARAALGELSANDQETLHATFFDQSAAASGATFRKRKERALQRLRQSFRRLYGIGD